MEGASASTQPLLPARCKSGAMQQAKRAKTGPIGSAQWRAGKGPEKQALLVAVPKYKLRSQSSHVGHPKDDDDDMDDDLARLSKEEDAEEGNKQLSAMEHGQHDNQDHGNTPDDGQLKATLGTAAASDNSKGSTKNEDDPDMDDWVIIGTVGAED